MSLRSPAENAVLNAIDKLGVPYKAIDIEPVFADTAAFCEKYGYPVETSCNLSHALCSPIRVSTLTGE